MLFLEAFRTVMSGEDLRERFSRGKENRRRSLPIPSRPIGGGTSVFEPSRRYEPWQQDTQNGHTGAGYVDVLAGAPPVED